MFGLDRINYREIKPGLLTHESLFGAGSKSYNTQGMALDKHRYDIFQHWVIGLGSGDFQIRMSGVTREHVDVPNVLFIGSKVEAMQRLIAEAPRWVGGVLMVGSGVLRALLYFVGAA